MKNAKNPKVDAYIAKAAPFAQPILNAIRERVLSSGVELEETLKWNSPSWTLEGKLLCGMAAFKAHCVFGFWHKDRPHSRPRARSRARSVSAASTASGSSISRKCRARR